MKPKQPRKKAHPCTLGQSYLVETVTKYYLGRLVAVHEHELELAEASWIADTGRYHEALRDGTASEVEPCPAGVIVGRGAIVSVVPWGHPLLRTVQ